MSPINHNSPSELSALLQRERLHLTKRFGQNFLVDRSVRERIGDLVEQHLPSGTALWEIGPGLGSLTSELVTRGMHPRLFEVDYGLARVLATEYGEHLSVEIGDFLETGPRIAQDERPGLIAGNLPYASASAMLARIIEANILPPVMVFLVQTEFAVRIAAGPGDSDYAAISVLVGSHYHTWRVFDVGPQAFFPRPRVGSRVIVMERHAALPSAALRSLASRLARQAFSQRRKTLRNSLRDYLALLDCAAIDPGARPEQLSAADFLRLAACAEAAEKGS